MKKFFTVLSLVILVCFFNLNAQNKVYGVDLDTVTAQKFDMGKMWTFENPPLDYFEQTYNFKPSEEWLEKVQKSALKFGRGCSASFISEDGLIMTNHHCIRSILRDMSTEDEDLLRNYFYAQELEDEKIIPNLYVNQLLMIKDVTDEIKSAMNLVESDSAKVAAKEEIIEKIKERNEKTNPELNYRVISLYYGGKYSLYGYKKYDDIRLVFAPELIVSKLGGDYDNFTYPRYGLDCAFLRAYDEDGNPEKTNHHFNFSTESIYENQLVFVVGNPGSTNRIYTLAQLEYLRDYRYGLQTPMRKDLYKVYVDLVNETNAEDMKLVATSFNVGNGLKVYEETYKALLNPLFIARKKAFEKNFKDAVQSNPELNNKYGGIWDEIAANRNEASTFVKEMFAYTIYSYFAPKYFFIAEDLIELAEQLKLPESERSKSYIDDTLEETIENIFPVNFNKELEDKKLLVQLNNIEGNLRADNNIVKRILNGKRGAEAVDYVLSLSTITNKEDVIQLANSGSDAILNSDDPFIYFILNTKDRLGELKQRNEKLAESDAINNQLLGEALFAVYGDAIPPDATGTLRISDGVLKGYNYNGTFSPYKTTFYGSLDRYYSFNQKFPFNLPDYWEDLPKDFDLSTPLNFVSTCDIIGGNSGSPVINTDAEVVGLAFDGNIESHSGRFIYTTEANRTVSVSAEGMIEAINDLYKAKRLADEILNGKLD
ncbi:MAG: S46 family peptidase [Ignavibacteria bacterium]|nr:S46 family peptidase [Ignavibacteria bacterium]MBT8380947.1 S46 family peptidase [Ignavibacteria bacterium]MBT8391873.1 S46 family peptidase [Ignavibacteria bacterium]NNJ52972.1 S46 family peptidase [Ignavibacteriaceae bacterium]NNL21447.1 S46 family peptidase [Ignavibacteriaceae bacterium]